MAQNIAKMAENAGLALDESLNDQSLTGRGRPVLEFGKSGPKAGICTVILQGLVPSDRQHHEGFVDGAEAHWFPKRHIFRAE